MQRDKDSWKCDSGRMILEAGDGHSTSKTLKQCRHRDSCALSEPFQMKADAIVWTPISAAILGMYVTDEAAKNCLTCWCSIATEADRTQTHA